MATVTYLNQVSDANVRAIIQRIANSLERNITVHSGDRNTVVRGSSQRSLHLQHRAADLHVEGLSDTQVFDLLKQRQNDLFDVSQAYEVIHHGVHTNTGGEHIHIGHYSDRGSGFVDFKLEGLTPGSGGHYSVDHRPTTNGNRAPVPSIAASGVTVSADVLSPNVGIYQSVGIGGNNRYGDVILAQKLLNKAQPRLKEARINFEHFQRLAEDGDCGRFTKNAITIFQRDVLGFSEPDGRIDPGGKTIRALYIAAYGDVSKIARRVRRVRTLSAPNTPNQTNGQIYNGILAWGSHPNVTDAFREKTVRICSELGIRNPSWLMTLMAFETGRTFSPSKRNEAGSGAVGLIQFMPTTIDGETRGGRFYAGIGQRLGITHSQLAGMTAIRQLDVVKAYFEQFGSRPRQSADVDDLYWLVLNPSMFGRPDDTPVFRGGTTAYRQNSGLDTNRDRTVTIQEVTVVIRGMLREGLDRFPYPRR